MIVYLYYSINKNDDIKPNYVLKQWDEYHQMVSMLFGK